MYAHESHLESLSLPAAAVVRASAVAVLLRFSHLLAAWAQRLAPVRHATAREPMLEFYAESGAPEGALYIDGKLVGRVSGVTRI